MKDLAKQRHAKRVKSQTIQITNSSIYTMSLLEFIDNAPCRNSDPWLFDQYQLDLAQPGLQYCRNCKFWNECDSLVKPESSNYDGIAGGKVWRNGNLLARLSPNSPYPLIVNEEREVFISVETVAVRGSDLLAD